MKIKSLADIILFENEDYILINKPPHFPTLEDRDETVVSILDLAKSYWSDAQVAHRLDKETSGVLAIAKNPDAYRHLSIQFEKREVHKVYHAVVGGVHNWDGESVDLPIYQNQRGYVRIDFEVGKPSITFFKTLEVINNHTLVECHPLTGRMHQIRIHLASKRAPIIADTLYGGKKIFLSELKRNFKLKKDTEEQPLMQRVALHAFSLRFKLLDGTEIFQEAPYPKDMSTLLKQLRNL